MLQLDKYILFGFRPKELFFCFTLGDLTQSPRDMRETKHELVVEISKSQKAVSSVRVLGIANPE